MASYLHVSFLVIRYERAGNQDLALNLADWVFKSRGVLRVGDVKHHKKGEKEPPQAYTIFDIVVGSILN